MAGRGSDPDALWVADVSADPAVPEMAGSAGSAGSGAPGPDGGWDRVARRLVPWTAIASAGAAALSAVTPLVTVRGTLRSGGPPQSELGLGRTETVRAVNLTHPSFGALQTSWPLAATVLGLGALTALAVAALTGAHTRMRTGPAARWALGLAPTVLATAAVPIAAVSYEHGRLGHPRTVRLGTVFADDASLGPAVWLCVASAALALLGAVIWLTTDRGGHRSAGRRLARFIRIRTVHRPT